jgi:hypothetical protein
MVTTQRPFFDKKVEDLYRKADHRTDRHGQKVVDQLASKSVSA